MKRAMMVMMLSVCAGRAMALEFDIKDNVRPYAQITSRDPYFVSRDKTLIDERTQTTVADAGERAGEVSSDASAADLEIKLASHRLAIEYGSRSDPWAGGLLDLAISEHVGVVSHWGMDWHSSKRLGIELRVRLSRQLDLRSGLLKRADDALFNSNVCLEF